MPILDGDDEIKIGHEEEGEYDKGYEEGKSRIFVSNHASGRNPRNMIWIV